MSSDDINQISYNMSYVSQYVNKVLKSSVYLI